MWLVVVWFYEQGKDNWDVHIFQNILFISTVNLDERDRHVLQRPTTYLGSRLPLVHRQNCLEIATHLFLVFIFCITIKRLQHPSIGYHGGMGGQDRWWGSEWDGIAYAQGQVSGITRMISIHTISLFLLLQYVVLYNLSKKP